MKAIAICLLFFAIGCGKKTTSPPDGGDEDRAPIAQPALESPRLVDPHRANCDHIFAVYQACPTKKIEFDGRDFTFDVGGVKTKVTCTDGRALDFFDRVDDMDVASTFLFKYDEGASPLPEVRKHHDPGRLRVEELLKATYGHSEAAARAQLVNVTFLNQKLPFSKSLGAAIALENLSKDLLALMKTDPAVKTFLEPFATGKIKMYTFFWRVVAGTSRLSAHSFGAAIDLVTATGPQYWLWDEQATNPDRAKRGEQAYRDVHFIPKGAPHWNMKVVALFEKHGFIWGGKWNHYDSMHFEYRPEFITNVKVNCPKPFTFAKTSDDELQEYFASRDLAESHDH